MCRAAWQQDVVADLLFDSELGLGLECVRVNIGASNTSAAATASMRPFGAVPSVLLADGTYNWELVRDDTLIVLNLCNIGS